MRFPNEAMLVEDFVEYFFDDLFCGVGRKALIIQIFLPAPRWFIGLKLAARPGYPEGATTRSFSPSNELCPGLFAGSPRRSMRRQDLHSLSHPLSQRGQRIARKREEIQGRAGEANCDTRT